MKVPPAPRLATCLIAYYAALFVAGMCWPFASDDPLKFGIGGLILGGIGLIEITHHFFFFSPQIQGDWFSYLMVGGIPAAIFAAAVQPSRWIRSLAIPALLFAAHFYGFVVAGMHF